MNDEARREVAEDLKPMFAKAESEGLWFYHYSFAAGELWFSPEALRREQQAGRFLWGSINWRLRPPSERLEQLRRKADEATQAYRAAVVEAGRRA